MAVSPSALSARFIRPVMVLVAAALSASAVADVSVPSPAAQSAADDANADCHAPESVAARRAIDTWCRGSVPVKRRWYDWSLARTRRQACADFHAAFASCAIVGRADLDGEPGPVVVVENRSPQAEATYWQAHLTRRGRDVRVEDVDFVEDCTGP